MNAPNKSTVIYALGVLLAAVIAYFSGAYNAPEPAPAEPVIETSVPTEAPAVSDTVVSDTDGAK